jgi:hypothetical protein
MRLTHGVWSMETIYSNHLNADFSTTLKQYEHTTALINHLQKRQKFSPFQSNQTCPDGYSSHADSRKICSVIVVYDGFD